MFQYGFLDGVPLVLLFQLDKARCGMRVPDADAVGVDFAGEERQRLSIKYETGLLKFETHKKHKS